MIHSVNQQLVTYVVKSINIKKIKYNKRCWKIIAVNVFVIIWSIKSVSEESFVPLKKLIAVIDGLQFIDFYENFMLLHFTCIGHNYSSFSIPTKLKRKDDYRNNATRDWLHKVQLNSEKSMAVKAIMWWNVVDWIKWSC